MSVTNSGKDRWSPSGSLVGAASCSARGALPAPHVCWAARGLRSAAKAAMAAVILIGGSFGLVAGEGAGISALEQECRGRVKWARQFEDFLAKALAGPRA